ncbi:hypothetical protein ACFQ5D_14810 [Paenibacillus farraposensis]|uniref:Uncharacterized protein n=1 Tax=Paenibacillus farraposensis TaxID=2807095 RepID=A0ABW4DFQ1_9BACL|nr:hypothetical protein [Paenibacillus farraposensis]MCC3382044.1 hypothetical protein [Paenibacillus farraposensis]
MKCPAVRVTRAMHAGVDCAALYAGAITGKQLYSIELLPPALYARREIRGDRAQLSPDGSSLPPPYGLGEILFGGGGT